MTLIRQLFLLGVYSLIVVSINAQSTEEEKRVFINNESTVNSEDLEFSPAFYEDGIVFISTKVSEKKYKITDKRIGKNIMSIFESRRADNGLLQPPTPFSKSLLSSTHEGPMTFDRTGENIFFSRNNVKNGKRIKAKDGMIKMQIFHSELVGKQWTNVEKLPFNDDQSNNMHPAISVEGDVLYFASDREGGLGGLDIWKVKKLGDSWGEPVNLGPTVNTDGDEVFPFIHADGTLYFASSGHPGFGGLDLFFCPSADNGEVWGAATNLAAPFNTENDDFGFIIDRDKKNGYFSSSRGGGKGQDDIYSFYVTGNLDELFDDSNRPKVMRSFILSVSDENGNEMIEGAKVVFTNLDNLSITSVLASDKNNPDSLYQFSNPDNEDLIIRVPMEEMGTTGLTDSWGKYPVDLTTGNYAFVIEKAGYKPKQIVLDTEAGQEEIFVTLVPYTAEELAAIAKGNYNYTTGEIMRPESYPNGANPDVITYDEENGSNNTSNNISNNSGSFTSTITTGTVFQLPNIYYNFNDASIRPDARVDLDALAGFMRQYPDVTIELSSHTDSRGGTRYNKKLSQKRADNAVEYLISLGIDPARMTPVGYGEEQIRNHCTDGKKCTEDEHQYNRRTTVKITRMDDAINIQFINDNSPRSATNAQPTYYPEDEEVDRDYNNISDGGTTSTGGYYSTGRYVVVAGVYNQYKNAEKKLRRLVNKGYANTEIQTVGSQYHIIVNRFDDRESAKNLQESLRIDEVDTYLKE